MSICLKQVARRTLAGAGLSVVLVLLGCSSWLPDAKLEPFLPGVQEHRPEENAPIDPQQNLQALRSPNVHERLSTLQAWNDIPPGPLPVEVTDLRSDPDPRVRAAVLAVLVHARHPQALDYATAALADYELQVRIAAVTALGEIGGPEALATLRRVATTEAEVVRAAAVTALAHLDAQQAVMEAAGDRSWRVRLAVARALPRYQNAKGIALASQLLDDPSSGVEQEVVKALAGWPIPWAGPLLLEAMGNSGYTTRKTAAQDLATRWPPAAEFPVDGPPERRAEVLGRLKQRFRDDIGPTDIAEVVRRAGPMDPAAGTVDVENPVVTTRKKATLEALDRMATSDAQTRRRAARDVAELADRQPLDPAAVERLVSLTIKQTDPLVWQDALAAVASDTTAPASQMAGAAIRHASPEVRRRGCEHLAAHPDVRQVSALVQALSDENDQVAAAAARALGAVKQLDDAEPLRRLLNSRNEFLRVEAAAALAKHGDPAGLPALERLAYSGDAVVRRQLAVVLGEVGGEESIPTLIRLLDDRPDIRRAALESLPKVVGEDVSRPVGQPTPTPSEQVTRWKQWFEERPASDRKG